MAANRKVKGGRTTPKASRTTDHGRYTPPIPKSQKVSPMWVPVLMFTLLIAGTLLIVLNYMNLIGHASNVKLLLGLLLISGGFIAATSYH